MSDERLGRDAMLEQLRGLMAKVFGVAVERIGADTTPDEIPRWDSLNLLTVMIGIERRLGISVPPEALEGVRDVGGVADAILRHALNGAPA
ncbi:acyl carrier protein [Endobacter medicaginis]|jgi:acyl carrier protein|uniref:Acyl carrier protein n=1 Tax=Endobacter medicaginis TaxID=1181271 RepID=A0A850NT36_9PROT|nr:acyl carrier protein [Endobacter medicaginis]MBB3173263.1 acyl carrier protein [Endobacter medicaginis]MCX5476375.1 acyl carrier protein [Endobacter medicaginis]NVN30515.1 acyl carrier protein [Endobacter medicaginis]